jgi:hypothetical protein
MLNFPPPPPPPVDASQLENLAEYYRSLVDYYRRAGAIASQQLAHVDALLHPNDKLAFGSSDDMSCWLETPSTNGSGQKAIASPLPQLSPLSTSKNHQTSEEEPLLAIEELQSKSDVPSGADESNHHQTDSQLMELLASELESNRGKMLHLDYLVRKLYGESDPSRLQSAREKTRSLLEQGAQGQKWFAVPDSPDCWTIDLSEFPDLIEQSNPSTKYPPHAPRKTLVGSERLADYVTVTSAIAACLQEHYPNSMTIKQIVDYFYPDGLSPSRRQKIHGSLGNALSAGNNQLWRRVKLGTYIWNNR